MTETRINFKWMKRNGTLYSHAWDRTIQRGISVDAVKEVISKGTKNVRSDRSIVAVHSKLKVIYRLRKRMEYRKYNIITAHEV